MLSQVPGKELGPGDAQESCTHTAREWEPPLRVSIWHFLLSWGWVQGSGMGSW